ncbi:hypothetical protein R3P38DRAFT_1652399 [Favolaschia claudopus]|uniref:Secreted protein n=1 Tax=Favolaschia claudopus TaxID=2862362 RepID=A0AAW0DQK9_9AGAR
MTSESLVAHTALRFLLYVNFSSLCVVNARSPPLPTLPTSTPADAEIFASTTLATRFSPFPACIHQPVAIERCADGFSLVCFPGPNVLSSHSESHSTNTLAPSQHPPGPTPPPPFAIPISSLPQSTTHNLPHTRGKDHSRAAKLWSSCTSTRRLRPIQSGEGFFLAFNSPCRFGSTRNPWLNAQTPRSSSFLDCIIRR